MWPDWELSIHNSTQFDIHISIPLQTVSTSVAAWLKVRKIQFFSPFLWWLLHSRSIGASLEAPTGVTSNCLWCQPLPSRLFHSCPSCALLTTDNLTFSSSHLDSATALPHVEPLPQSPSRRLLCYTTTFQHPVPCRETCGVIVVLEFVLFSLTVKSLSACSGETNLQTTNVPPCSSNTNCVSKEGMHLFFWRWHEVFCS